jgi:outer membrane lipoprotein LolB
MLAVNSLLKKSILAIFESGLRHMSANLTRQIKRLRAGFATRPSIAWINRLLKMFFQQPVNLQDLRICRLPRLNQWSRYFSLTFVVLLLNACASLDRDAGPTVEWLEHQLQMAQLQQWELQGRLNIRSESESNTINIVWRQADNAFDISLSGALGSGAVRISGTPDLVILQRAGEDPVFSQSLDSISSDFLGYEFPASDLYYWIRGVPAPTRYGDLRLNSQQQLAGLQQSDWQLQYDRYRANNGLFLPHQIVLEQKPYRLTFLVNRWRLDQQTAPGITASP